ncbi:hypothetical protein [Mycolicibacter algericus]|uniref:hypothetical protein n=1 Tax=Mycolicibacter algericus TaxID=1288388 RepID=UPI003C725E4B
MTFGLGVGGHPHNVVLKPFHLGGELLTVKSGLRFDGVERFGVLLQNSDFMMEPGNVIGDLIAIEPA